MLLGADVCGRPAKSPTDLAALSLVHGQRLRLEDDFRGVTLWWHVQEPSGLAGRSASPSKARVCGLPYSLLPMRLPRQRRTGTCLAHCRCHMPPTLASLGTC
eukprot:8921351-Pyramimonas_sp.AAC.1